MSRDPNLVFMEREDGPSSEGLWSSAGAYEWAESGAMGARCSWGASCCGGLVEGLPKAKATALVAAEGRVPGLLAIFALFVGHRGADSNHVADRLVPRLRTHLTGRPPSERDGGDLEPCKAALAAVLAGLAEEARADRRARNGTTPGGATGCVVLVLPRGAVVASLGHGAACALYSGDTAWSWHQAPPLSSSAFEVERSLENDALAWDSADYTAVEFPAKAAHAQDASVVHLALGSLSVVQHVPQRPASPPRMLPSRTAPPTSHVGFAHIGAEAATRPPGVQASTLEAAARRLAAAAERVTWTDGKTAGLIEDLSIALVEIIIPPESSTRGLTEPAAGAQPPPPPEEQPAPTEALETYDRP